MDRYDISTHKGTHLWKWLLVIGGVLIVGGMYLGAQLHDTQDTRFKLDIHSAFWALCVLLLSVLVFVGLVGLEEDLEAKVGLIIVVQLVLGGVWAFFDYKESVNGLLITQVLILATVGYLIYLFLGISRFGVVISIVYFLSVAYATYLLLTEKESVFADM
jgi:hypothetical protein